MIGVCQWLGCHPSQRLNAATFQVQSSLLRLTFRIITATGSNLGQGAEDIFLLYSVATGMKHIYNRALLLISTQVLTHIESISSTET